MDYKQTWPISKPEILYVGMKAKQLRWYEKPSAVHGDILVALVKNVSISHAEI